ncbi:MAG: lycopene cyclase domain-containing protein [Verrucomicrobiota bacterium]
MTYLTFLLVFILPLILAAYFLCRLEKKPNIPLIKSGMITLSFIALLYTSPWDNYLVASNVWGYGDERVIDSMIIGFVPIEEYMFMFLQPIATGLFLQYFVSQNRVSLEPLTKELNRGNRISKNGMILFLFLSIIGVILYFYMPDQFNYLGLILVWACPVLAFQCWYGGELIWKMKRILLPALIVPTVYLCLVDMIAIDWQIWHIRPETSTGWKILSLPFEEGLFFLITNLLVVQGLILFYQASTRWKLRHRKNDNSLIQSCLIFK